MNISRLQKDMQKALDNVEKLRTRLDKMVAEIFALCMFVNSSLDGHMITDGMSHCLKLKREAERNLSEIERM